MGGRCPMTMPGAPDKDYHIAKAEQCFRLAAGCTDRTIAASLRELGYEFVDTAVALGADRSLLPQEWRRLDDR